LTKKKQNEWTLEQPITGQNSSALFFLFSVSCSTKRWGGNV